MYDDFDTKRFSEQFRQSLPAFRDPPCYIYARAPSSKAPYRFKAHQPLTSNDKRLVKGLRSRGLKVHIWSPKPKSDVPSSKFWQTVEAIISDLCQFFHDDRFDNRRIF